MALKAARDTAEQAARIVRAKQREGQVDGLLDAERSFAEAEAQLAAADASIAAAQIDLFRALGGGRGMLADGGPAWQREQRGL